MAKIPPMLCAVHDLSGVGRCALTVVMPVLSAMGVEVCPAPTAVLSTHTGGFENIASVDLSELLPRIFAHWTELALRFDALYTGYLANPKQAEAVLLFRERQERALFVVDPVMGDDGCLYSAMPKEMPAQMRTLCAKADVITPNLTEACLLLDRPYRDSPGTMKDAEEMLKRLLSLGCERVVLNGFPISDTRRADLCASRGDSEIAAIPYDVLPVHYPGTGDLFASVLTGLLLRGRPLSESVRAAGEFTRKTIRQTLALATEPRMGVALENLLTELPK